jgi:lipoprotein-anchoring transpeptidase ErfK/SrfK
VVREALDASSNASFFQKMRMRVFSSDLSFERPVAITYPRKGARGYVEGLASSFNRDPRDATIDYSTGWVDVVKEQEGRKVAVADSFSSIMSALRTGAPEAELTVRTTQAEVSSDIYKKVLLVRIGENKLYLYENGKITHTWPVATGQPSYPTPTGLYEIVEKRYMPTWVNPAPTTWGASMPASIPPGTGNPLGLRALNWSAPAIRFHGTEAIYSLGYNASHGCVRMANADVIELYDMVDVGTPIVSTVVAPLRPLYSTSTYVDPTPVDPTPVETDAPADDSKTDSKAGKGKGN